MVPNYDESTVFKQSVSFLILGGNRFGRRIVMKQHIVNIVPLTQVIGQRKGRPLGHAIRAGARDCRDPLYPVAFETYIFRPKPTAYRRAKTPANQ